MIISSHDRITKPPLISGVITTLHILTFDVEVVVGENSCNFKQNLYNGNLNYLFYRNSPKAVMLWSTLESNWPYSLSRYSRTKVNWDEIYKKLQSERVVFKILFIFIKHFIVSLTCHPCREATKTGGKLKSRFFFGC